MQHISVVGALRSGMDSWQSIIRQTTVSAVSGNELGPLMGGCESMKFLGRTPKAIQPGANEKANAMNCPSCKKEMLGLNGPPVCPSCARERTAESGSDAPTCSPLRVAYSREDMESKMREWMVNQFGHPRDYINDPDQRNAWYRDNGLLYHFICDHFPSENVIGEARADSTRPLHDQTL